MNFLVQRNTDLTVLLVEDDDGDARALQRSFKKASISFPIVRAVDGIEALEFLKGANGKQKISSPYLLLVDLNMPKMNGIELIKELRADANLRHSIVFVLTTSKRDEDKMAAYDLNAAGYIAKATAGEDFLNLVGLVDNYRRIVEMP
jgi:CheY-like chemotaxis protein